MADLELRMKWFANADVSKVLTSTKNRYARADTAVHPYAEDLCSKNPHQSMEAALQRDARWNVEWVGRKPDIPHFVGCKPVQTRRLAGRAPSTMAITNIDNHIPKSRHRGWSTHIASRRYGQAQPNRTSSRSFVTPGGIGTHRMHPPRKRTHSSPIRQIVFTEAGRSHKRRTHCCNDRRCTGLTPLHMQMEALT